MIVTAALCWWNERPADLEACVKGIANIADRLVAVDGSYRRYPDATITSPSEQAEAIRRACERAGIECVIHLPDRLWAGQVEKRTFLLREAAKDSDWIVVVDTDHIIHTDRQKARAVLAAMPPRVRFVSVDFFTPLNKRRSLANSAATNWHVNAAGQTTELAHIFRALPDFEVRKKHWHYYGTWGGSEVRLLYGGKADEKLPVPYVVEHRTLFRTRKQVLDSRAFLNDRQMVVQQTGQEDDVPGLPVPTWDFVTVPYPVRSLASMDGNAVVQEVRTKIPFDQPIRVLTLAEAEHALKSGYQKVFVRLNDSTMSPAVRSGQVVLLTPTVPKAGDLSLVHVLGHWRIRRVADVTPTGRMHVSNEHSPATHLVTRFIGTVAWSGDKQEHYGLGAETEKRHEEHKQQVSLRKDTPAPAAPKRRGRPRKQTAVVWP